MRVASVRQHDALGLGHAILRVSHLLDGNPSAVLLPDVHLVNSVER